MSRAFLISALLSMSAALVSPSSADGQSPSGRLSLHVDGVLFQPKASGSVFDLAESELGIRSSEYRHVRPSVEVALPVHPRLSLMGSWSSGSKEIQSTIHQGIAPQSTHLRMENAFAGGLVLHLAHWGNDGVWRLDVLGGAGRQSFAFGQTGVFPDASSPGATFSGAFHTDGKADLQFAGLRLNRAISQRLGLSAGARYQWSEAEVSGDYQGFRPISLSGFGIAAGIQLTL